MPSGGHHCSDSTWTGSKLFWAFDPQYAVFPILIRKPINVIYTSSDCLRFSSHVDWFNGASPALLVPACPCCSSVCVIVWQANGMENAALEVLLGKQLVALSVKDTSKCQRLCRANGEIRTWKRLLPPITGVWIQNVWWIQPPSEVKLMCSKVACVNIKHCIEYAAIGK